MKNIVEIVELKNQVIVDENNNIVEVLERPNNVIIESVGIQGAKGDSGGGISSINALTELDQFIEIGVDGNDVNIVSTDDTHTINIPTASATKRGAVDSTDWTNFNSKQDALGFTPENVANKENTTLDTSTTKYPTNNLVKTNLDLKVDKEAGKGLSTNDYTNIEKTKLAGIEDGATQNQTNAYLLDRANHTGTQAINTVSGLQDALNDKANELDLQNHIDDTNNPHATTKAQVGLGNVDNTSDLDKPISTATQTALNDKANELDLQNHIDDTNNPHATTKAQVGLGNVDNTSDLDKPISTATQTALDDKVDKINITAGSLGSPSKTSSITYNEQGQITSASEQNIQIAQSQVNNLTIDLAGKEPTVTAGTTSQYYRGDKTFQTLDTSVVPENTNLYFTEGRTRATDLTGLNITGGSISSSDSILNAFGKVQNQINGLIGGAIYQGVWNATTNTPTLISGVGTAGYYYIVNVAGSTNLNGITDWKVGDWAIFDGTVWQKVDNTDAVSSVNGQTGAVNLTTADIADTLNKRYVSDAQLVVLGNTSNTNTGDQTSIVGITGTKAEFDTALSDANFLYVGDVTQYTDEMAQDAVGGIVDTTLIYNDATPSLKRAALTGAITAAEGSNSTSLGSFTTTELNAALSDNDIATGGGTATGTNTGDNAINTNSNAYADAKVADSITNGVTTIAPSQNAVFDALALKQDQDNLLDSISTLAGNGIIVRKNGNDAETRSIVAGSSKITIGNGSGVSDNPSIDLGTVAIGDITNLQTTLDGKQTTTLTSGNILVGNVSNVAASVTMSGDATISNLGVIAIGVGKITNTMLAGSIANNKLTNSTISGISLGSNLNTLTISAPLSGSSYNGSSAISIGLASGYGDSQNPYASKTANYFLAAPNGVAGVPTFRAIVAADIPTLNQNTTGSAAKLTTARTIWGQSFDGSANITGNITATAANLTNATNQLVLGTTLTQTISAVAPSVSRVGTIRDFGANFVFPQATAGFNCFFTTTNNTTAIFPTSGSQTLVNTTTAQTISNKTLTLASAKGLQFAWLNDTDITKTASIVVNDSQTASTQTSHVLPSVSGTLINDAVTTLSSLASVGTITTGTWSATTIAVNKGGSGRTSATAYGVICGGTTSTAAHQSVAVGSSGQFLASAGAGALPAMRNLAKTDMPTGSVVQVIQTLKTSVFSSSSTSLTDWTDMTATIVTTTSTSDILVSMTSGVNNDTNNSFQYVYLFFNVNGGTFTQIAMGDTASSAQRCWIDAACGTDSNPGLLLKPLTGEFLHAHGQPAGSTITYKLQVKRTYAGTAYFGRTANLVDANRSSIPSTLTIKEIL